jgi:fimbrial chaperone protein
MGGAAGARRGSWLRLLALLPAALGAWASLACAQSITVSPLRADLSAAEPVAVVSLRNEDPRQPTVIQVRPSAWAVVDGADQHSPTRDLLVSPTVFRLAPGEEQVVRVSLRGRPDARSERLYRLFFQQVPDEAAERRTGNVRFLITVGIPVVVAPSANAAPSPRIVWRIERGDAGEYRLRASNEGTAHLKISGVTLPGAAGDLRIVAAATYLLPGTERTWAFKPAAPLAAGPVNLTVMADDGTASGVQASVAD